MASALPGSCAVLCSVVGALGAAGTLSVLMASPPDPPPAAARDTELSKKLRALAKKVGAPLTVAHRGASRVCPENTLVSFRTGVEAGAHMVELDFRQTKDDVLAILHDRTLDRTTDVEDVLGRTKVAIHEVTMADLGRVDAGGWKHARFRGTPVPTLDQALDVIQSGSIGMLEHKAGDADKVVALLRRRKLVDAVLVQSFDWTWLQELHRLEPRITIGALGDKRLTAERLTALQRTGASMVHWSGKDLRVGDVEQLHARGYLVCVYTLNTDVELVGAAALGVDAITTDIPSHMLLLTAGGHLKRPKR